MSEVQTVATPAQTPADAGAEALPEVVDSIAVARLYGEPLFRLPQDLYIPPDALEVFLETFEGPLDLLLYLIRKQNFNILDIPLADVTRPPPRFHSRDSRSISGIPREEPRGSGS